MQIGICLEEELIPADPDRQLHFIKWRNVQEMHQLSAVT